MSEFNFDFVRTVQNTGVTSVRQPVEMELRLRFDLNFLGFRGRATDEPQES